MFQPHRYSRLQALCDDFVDAFADADTVVLVDVFPAGEMPIPGVTSKMLADKIRAAHPDKQVRYASDHQSLMACLDEVAQAGDLLTVSYTHLDVYKRQGMSNAVNLTDGLDGLAGGTVMISMIVMAAVCFVCHDANLAIFCAACAGGCIGFLWFNAYPAQIFMGDTGSLALGGALAAVAVLTNTEVVSLVVGGLFIT